jgi:hypothetical protein
MTTLQEPHTDATEEETEAPEFITPEIRREAAEFINSLAAVAGDGPAVYDALRDFCQGQKVEDAFAIVAAASLLIFSECITEPVAPGDYAPVIYPDNRRNTDV